MQQPTIRPTDEQIELFIQYASFEASLDSKEPWFQHLVDRLRQMKLVDEELRLQVLESKDELLKFLFQIIGTNQRAVIKRKDVQRVMAALIHHPSFMCHGINDLCANARDHKCTNFAVSPMTAEIIIRLLLKDSKS